MRKTLMLDNIMLTEGKDGFWIFVTASDGKQAGLSLNNLGEGIVRDAFIQWAKDNLDKQE